MTEGDAQGRVFTFPIPTYNIGPDFQWDNPELDLQDALQARYTGGTVFHAFLGEALPDPRVVREFIRKVFQRYRLPYLTLSPTFSICDVHGYLSGEAPACPHCGAETEVYARIVGYMRPVSQWNRGKQAEYRRRRCFRIDAA
jgi:ribonucleoside-triphosphate reductase